MKITLKRKVTLKSAVVYLKLRVEVQRDDIKNYIQSEGFPNQIIERRVRGYLRSRGIYDSQNQLTAEGKKARDTGMVEETEEGKYQIWYTQDDPLFGNRIFYFRRIKPDTYSPQMERLDLYIKSDEKNFVSLPIWGKKEPVNFFVADAGNGYQGENRDGTTIDCTWTWGNMQTSFFVFNGNFEWPEYDEKAKKETKKSDRIDGKSEVDLKFDLRPHIPVIIPGWNEDTNRCKIRIEHININDVYQHFEYSGSRPREGFDSCYYDKLPVEPYNAEEALVWRNQLLKMELEKQYMHPDDFICTAIAINQKEGFTAYTDHLQQDIPDIHTFIDKELEHGKKSDRKAVYWHLAAPLDLNVDIPRSLRIDSFSLKPGDCVSFGEIAGKFKSGFSVKKICYFDSYVINYYQQRSVAAFLKSFCVSDMRVITGKSDQYFNDYLSKREPQISVEDIGNIYQNRKDAPHDRYLVLIDGSDLQVWTGTNSIDYIRFKNTGNIQSETPGNVLKSVTFTRIKPDVLETRLKNFILKGAGNDADKN
jgi:hypothetical protein